MPETPDFEKQQIVAALNQRYRTTLCVEMIQVAVTRGFTSWEALRLDAGANAPQSEHEDNTIDAEIGDQERGAELAAMADRHIFDLDWDRRMETAQAEFDIERQMADFERESDL